MEQLIALTGRNLRLYLRDKGAVFFSLMSMGIVVLLMIFFLGDMNVENITAILDQIPGRDGKDAAADAKNAELLVLSWTCAGILSINGVTVTLSAYSIMIKDRVSGRHNSIYTAPVSRSIITAGYMASAWIASVLICTVTLILTEAYGMTQGLSAFSPAAHGKIFVMILVNSFVYAGLMYLMAQAAKTEGAWSGLGTVVGTLVGFLGGIYIPIGALSDVIGTIMKCTPILYGTAMFRSVMTEEILEETFRGVSSDVISEYRDVMGIDLTVFDHQVNVNETLLLLLIFGILCLGLGALLLRRGQKTDR